MAAKLKNIWCFAEPVLIRTVIGHIITDRDVSTRTQYFPFFYLRLRFILQTRVCSISSLFVPILFVRTQVTLNFHHSSMLALEKWRLQTKMYDLNDRCVWTAFGVNASEPDVDMHHRLLRMNPYTWSPLRIQLIRVFILLSNGVSSGVSRPLMQCTQNKLI